MKKDQAKKLLDRLISNSKLSQKCFNKSLKNFDTLNYIDLSGDIDNYDVSISISLSSSDNYKLVLRFNNIYNPNDSSVYSEHDFKSAVELINFKLKSNIDVETFCQDSPLEYLDKLFGKREDILVITNKDNTRFSITRLDYEHELTIENIDKVYNTLTQKPQRISEIYINLCFEQWEKLNIRTNIISESNRQITVKSLNELYNELGKFEKELFINKIIEPTFVSEYLTYLGVDSDLVERLKGK